MQQPLSTAIIGGGATGLFLATRLLTTNGAVAMFERGNRVGRKLSATGNGQGNISNLAVEETEYFSISQGGNDFAHSIITRYPYSALKAHLEKLGVLLLPDDRGRVYPTGRQASAITDALRFAVEQKGISMYLNTQVTKLTKQGELFHITAKTENGEREYFAKNVVLCTGGKASKNFGTDGTAYALAQGFGHTLTTLYPSLVQVKTETKKIKTLKGIRVSPARVTATWQEQGVKKSHTVDGDILFTDYGVSGDAIFRLSAFFTHAISTGVTLSIHFLPEFTAETIEKTLIKKRALLPSLPFEELLGGIVNNQVGRAVIKSVGKEDFHTIANAVCAFDLDVVGTLGFDYAQVTKGGIPVNEVLNTLQSKKIDGLYLAGEMLDIDGQCGGFNLQWAFSSSACIADELNEKDTKERGQVCV